MTTIYLIRHAEAEGNVYRRFQGWYDGLITPNGYAQIAALEQRFDGVPIDAAYSSDLFRTMTTARAVCKPRGLELQTDPGLREIGGGVWEGKAWGELYRNEPEALAAFFRADPAWQVEGGETYGGVQERMVRTLRRIAAAHDGQTLAVFSHGTAIRTALAGFLGYPPEEILRVPHGDNTAVSKLVFDGDRVEIAYYNDNSHLGELSTQNRQTWKNSGADDFAMHNLWFRPLDLKTEEEFFRQSRREAWETIHHTMQGFDADSFFAAAVDQSDYDRGSVLVAMRGEHRAGILQLDFRRDAARGIGAIPFCYLTPETRMQGLGAQLLGQAVFTYRALGREVLRLRCDPGNGQARRFYGRHGFRKVGQEPGGLGMLDVLECPIGYNPR